MSLNLYFDHSVLPIQEGEMATNMEGFDFYPVLNSNHELIGTLAEESVFSYQSEQLSIQPELIISENLHPLEILKKFQSSDSNILFILNEGKYQGAITYHSIIDYFNDQIQFTEPQTIIVFSSEIFNYSISEITRIIESEGAQINYLSIKEEDNLKLITLALSQVNLNRITSILRNKNYQILHIYNDAGANSQLQDRYENLINYLNI